MKEKKSPRGERATEEAIANGFLMENGEKWSEKPSNMTENDEGKAKKQPNLSVSDEKQSKKQPKKQPKLKIPEFPSQIFEDRKLKYLAEYR